METEHLVNKVELANINQRANHLERDTKDLFDEAIRQNKWYVVNDSASEPNDIEFLEYHYHRLIRKYDVPFKKLEDVKNLCLSYLKRAKAEEQAATHSRDYRREIENVRMYSSFIRETEQSLVEEGK